MVEQTHGTSSDDVDLGWWGALRRGLIHVLDGDLESSPMYSGCQDFLSAVPLRPASGTELSRRKPLLKVAVAAYPLTRCLARDVDGDVMVLSKHPDAAPRPILVRVYLVQGEDLWRGSESDTSLNINYSKSSIRSSGTTLGSSSRSEAAIRNTARSRSSYVVARLPSGEHAGGREYAVNGVTKTRFAQILELRGWLPTDWLLTLSVFGVKHEEDTEDILLGETAIDIENRVYSAHRAGLSLPSSYCQFVSQEKEVQFAIREESSEYRSGFLFVRVGWQRWRESEPPSALLTELCTGSGLPPPRWDDYSVTVGRAVVAAPPDSPTGNCKEDTALRALQYWHRISGNGRPLVRTCLETRAVPPSKGRLVLWVDVLPLSSPLPAPVDISLPEARPLVLTCRVDRLHDLNGVPRKLAARAWLSGYRAGAVRTSVTKCPRGADEASVQWQAQLPLLYSPLDRRLLVPPRQFSRQKRPFLRHPRLHLQLLGRNRVNNAADVSLGHLCVDLNHLPLGLCSDPRGDLFDSSGIASGTWAFRSNPRGQIPGKADLTLSLSPMDVHFTKSQNLAGTFDSASSTISQESVSVIPEKAFSKSSKDKTQEKTAKLDLIKEELTAYFNENRTMIVGALKVIVPVSIFVMVIFAFVSGSS